MYEDEKKQHLNRGSLNLNDNKKLYKYVTWAGLEKPMTIISFLWGNRTKYAISEIFVNYLAKKSNNLALGLGIIFICTL